MWKAVAMMRSLVARPPVRERRLHARVLMYWQGVARGRDLVPLEEFDWLSLEEDSSHGFLLDLRQPDLPVFSYVGPVLAEEARIDGMPAALASVGANSLLARFGSQFQTVLDSAKPITADYEFVTAAGYRVLCRGALLPLSTSGVAIDHVYGAVSWKSEKVA
jgi:hypothetical protein